jgi:hypothetical protein
MNASIYEKFPGIEFTETLVHSWCFSEKTLNFSVEFSLWPENLHYEVTSELNDTCLKKGNFIFERVSSIEGLLEMESVSIASDAPHSDSHGYIESLNQLCHHRFNIVGEFGNIILESKFPRALILDTPQALT